MKSYMKRFAALALAGTMTLGMTLTAMAATDDVTRDETSKFTESGDAAATGIDSFYLIKDYDSFAQTAAAPKAKSPAETFTYEIKPYYVWNAGSTYDASGVATAIDVTNMPMLTSEGMTTTGTGADRVLKVTQDVAISDAKYEATADTQNVSDNKVQIDLPTYDTVGDYWYVVEETITNKTTGVYYGTNSNVTPTDLTADNGGHLRTYYVHVQVTETSATAGTSELVKNVTLHTSAPATSLTNAGYNAEEITSEFYVANNKVNAIENTYYAGDLVLKKVVTGNAGDKDAYFKVTVTFTKPAGSVVNSDIDFTATALSGTTYTSTNYIIVGQKSEVSTTGKTKIEWTGSGSDTAAKTATCVFYMKDNDTITFENIPYGINYEVIEEKPENDTYKNEIKFTDGKDAAAPVINTVTLTSDTDSASLSDDFTKTATGSISDATDEITITNDKTTIIDIGVIVNSAPYVVMLLLAGAGAVIFARRRKDNMIEE